MARNQISRSVVIAAPAARIFDILADPRRHPDMDGSGSVRGVVRGPDRLERGSEFGMDMKLLGLPYRITNRVVEYERNRLIAWRHGGPHRWRWHLEPVDEHTTRVTETFDYSRGGAVVYKLIGAPARNARGIEATLPRLKDLAERPGGASAP
ncbi:SRPBCC family protein [Actinorugispora endophytica]|uniref:Ribosome-associated toxin RatA of RatAB toxin-antitoxin module n=1 Tax=Actinorugispora endophytica TaxID=1605990 RepID=A0A4R6V8E7_9ACTN|nr:SRPBCC family protein [Actinorugispora endophytica]TDQ55028.1 ribosome-associated toxin RatA of RatAB toxin-antitoxin module [Actinorugispora endophytica]